MSETPEVAKFKADMSASKELREKFDAAAKRIADEGGAESDGELFEKAAAELGYQITTTELERLAAEQEELDSEELEQVAGGGRNEMRKYDSDWNERWCWFDWHCYTALMHTTPERDNEITSCWENFRCVFINKEDVE